MTDDNPIFLYLKPHSAHKEMMESINAEFVEATRGGPYDRVMDAKSVGSEGRIVITEGGLPLFQAVWMKKFNNCDKIIHLAADETIPNIFDPYDYYSTSDRLVHFLAHRYVDVVLGISDKICEHAKLLGIEDVRKIRPFTTKYEKLKEIEPDYDSKRLMSLGTPVPKNGMHRLEDISRETGYDIEVVSDGTEDYFDYDGVTGHGWVSEDEFIDIMSRCSGFIMPADGQMFSVAVIEGMHAGLIPIVTQDVGASEIINDIDSDLVRKTDTQDLIKGVRKVENKDTKHLSSEVEQIAEWYKPERCLDNFNKVWCEVK